VLHLLHVLGVHRRVVVLLGGRLRGLREGGGSKNDGGRGREHGAIQHIGILGERVENDGSYTGPGEQWIPGPLGEPARDLWLATDSSPGQG